jgi:hypothetical protein
LLGNRRDVDVAPYQRPARDLREMEHVVDELRHLLCAGPHALEKMDASLVERAAAVVRQEHLAEPVDHSQRRAQVVRHGIRKRLQLPVGRGQRALLHFQLHGPRLQLPGAVGHSSFHRRARFFDFRVLAFNLGQHLVERADELLDLGGASYCRSTDRIVLAVRDRRGERGESENRAGDRALRQLREEERDQQRRNGHEPRNEREPPPRLIVFVEVHANEERSQRKASGGNRPRHRELVIAEPMTYG